MAGFDFEFKCGGPDLVLGRNILRRVQRLGRNLDLEFRYSRTAQGWWVRIDGSLLAMQALIEPLASDITSFTDGYIAGARGVSHRRADKQFLNEYLTHVARMREQIEQTASDFNGSHYSYFFNVGPATHLQGHASELATALVSFHNGRRSGSEIIEETHTFVEAVLKACLPKEDRDNPFASLVDRVASLVHLQDDDRRTLLELKDMRRPAKHQARRVPRQAAANMIPEITAILHIIFRYIEKSRTESKAAQQAVAADVAPSLAPLGRVPRG